MTGGSSIAGGESLHEEKDMKTIFFGSDDFALVHLQYLVEHGYEVLACVTQPDRARGRGWKIIISPIKEYALEQGIPVWQPENIHKEDFLKKLEAIPVDVYVVIAYGRFLPEPILQLPRWGALNVHASLLPKYRGAAPINWAVIQGESLTGITIIKLNTTMDGGDIIDQIEMGIAPEDDSVSLRRKMLQAGPPFLGRVLEAISQNTCQLRPQLDAEVTYAPKLKKSLGLIQWEQPAHVIHNLVRGMKPWPCMYTYWKGKILKIFETAVVDVPFEEPPGSIIQVNKQGITMATGEQALLIKRVQLENARPMDAQAFSIGHCLEVGDMLGKA